MKLLDALLLWEHVKLQTFPRFHRNRSLKKSGQREGYKNKRREIIRLLVIDF